MSYEGMSQIFFIWYPPHCASLFVGRVGKTASAEQEMDSATEMNGRQSTKGQQSDQMMTGQTGGVPGQEDVERQEEERVAKQMTLHFVSSRGGATRGRRTESGKAKRCY